MATMFVRYTGALRNIAKHSSGVEIFTDAPIDNHGKGESFSPTDLLCTSLASCMLTIMGIEAQKWKIPFETAEAHITKVMHASPRKIARIHIEIRMPDSLYEHPYQNKIEQAGLTCPVALSLHPDLVQDVHFIYKKGKS